MKLYYSPGVCSLSPHIVARELGLALELVKVDSATKTLADGSDFLAINPRGYVPILELDDGQRISEGPAIVQLLADLKPESGLVPANGTLPRYRVQEWLGFINSELHKGMAPLFDASVPAEVKAAARRKLAGRFDWASAQIEGKAFAMGEQFTVVDAYLFTVLGWTPYVGMDLSQWPVLKAYIGRIGERPAVQAAMRAEGLIK